MTLVLVAANPAPAPAPSAQWAHDIRNALAVASLHLETLERLSGAAGRKAASAAQATLSRAAGLCNASLADKAPGAGARRAGFDLMPVLREIAAVLGGVAPASFAIRIPAETAAWWSAIRPTSIAPCSISCRTRSPPPAAAPS